MRSLKASATWLTVLSSVALLGCKIEISDPAPVVIQVIEELDFAPSLNIDLAAMQLTGTGIYVLDLTVGEGEPVDWGEQVFVAYTGWLYDGTGIDAGEVGFLMGNTEVIPGFEQGIFGMRLGGKRRIIIPPALAYGEQAVDLVPPGSVLVFEIEVLDISR
jgi:FKBP-type peptidyl-prolyl cis-trans isomerase FkpA